SNSSMIGSDSIVTVILDLDILETNTLWKEAPTVIVLGSWRKNSRVRLVGGVGTTIGGVIGAGGGGRILGGLLLEDGASTSLSVIVASTSAIDIAS
ncbi:MAG: hypothetical protein CO040_02515, partial [Candidatus Pacebacteria bacterium CG_4_9_14_0_2_um_filter_36_8]